MKYSLVIFISLLVACDPPDVQDGASTLLEVDRHFSEMSQRQGMIKAFSFYAHQNAVKLRENNFPIWNKAELIESFKDLNDSSFILSWEPLKAEIAASLDLGYTIGNWQMISSTDTTFGNYVSIWKKDASGNWKFVLDTGTSTPGWFVPDNTPITLSEK